METNEATFNSLSPALAEQMQRMLRDTVSARERNIVSQFLANAEKELEEKDHVDISKLEIKHSSLETKMEMFRSVLSPIHRMPPEILMRIFAFNCLKVPDIISISRVCARWRAIALSTASLWLGIEADPEAIKFREWRHILQKTFLNSLKGPPKESEMPRMDQLFTTIEAYENMDVDYLTYSKLVKIMRHIAVATDDKVPKDGEYRFRERSKKLVDRWYPIWWNAKDARTKEVERAAASESSVPFSH
ncbi:hypothetical protein V5O48_010193 [Marasmius crinis-equi]|uniref:F-box domain-containing protein n=1 Tax=Marasmius crinis-equi TaxID=585013 RepID=A0ABR3F969_9AGAR